MLMTPQRQQTTSTLHWVVLIEFISAQVVVGHLKTTAEVRPLLYLLHCCICGTALYCCIHSCTYSAAVSAVIPTAELPFLPRVCICCCVYYAAHSCCIRCCICCCTWPPSVLTPAVYTHVSTVLLHLLLCLQHCCLPFAYAVLLQHCCICCCVCCLHLCFYSTAASAAVPTTVLLHLLPYLPSVSLYLLLYLQQCSCIC